MNAVPVMAFCKKCKQEVMPGSACPMCGQKLPANGLRLSWSYGLAPVKDFLSWNNSLRVALPVLGLLALVITGVEWGRKGFVGLQALFSQGLLVLMMILAAVMLFIILIALMSRGREEVRYVLDNKGVHAQVWQAKASLIKRIFRMIPPDAQIGSLGQPEWMLEEKHIPWAELKRVGLWSDNDKILLYSPRFWLVLTLHALPDTYDDAVRFIYEQVKKRPGVMKEPPMPRDMMSQQM